MKLLHEDISDIIWHHFPDLDCIAFYLISSEVHNCTKWMVYMDNVFKGFLDIW